MIFIIIMAKSRKIPSAVIAARKAEREIEFEILGNGFHARTRVAKNKKKYSRKNLKINYFD